VQLVPLEDVAGLVEGALGVRVSNGYLRAWRLPIDDVPLHDPMLVWMASLPAGVRLRFRTDSRQVRLGCDHVVLDGTDAPEARYDLVIDDEVVTTQPAAHHAITIISPIVSPSREHDATTAVRVGETEVVGTGDLTLEHMRAILGEVVDLNQQRGDDKIDYLDGRELLGEADVDCLPDGLHPDDEGNRRIAERFAAHFA
jgi:hypothetical protein